MAILHGRVGAFRGLASRWHSDPNPRGAHPNAGRPLDPGGGVLVYRGCPFRCSVIVFRGRYAIPLDLNAIHFRLVVRASRWGDLEVEIKVEPASVFWEEIVGVAAGPQVVGSLGASVIEIKGGFLRTCPLDFSDIRERNSQLDTLPWRDAIETAQANPIPKPRASFEVVMNDPDRWDVWFGWRDPHCTIWDPWVRRMHVTGCPLRQNASGQQRKVAKMGRKVKRERSVTRPGLQQAFDDGVARGRTRGGTKVGRLD